jgi:hypothetical protein
VEKVKNPTKQKEYFFLKKKNLRRKFDEKNGQKNWAEKKMGRKEIGAKKKFGRKKNLAEKILADILAATPTGPRHHTHQLFLC